MTKPRIEIDLFPDRNRDKYQREQVEIFLRNIYLVDVREKAHHLRNHVNHIGHNADAFRPALGGERRFQQTQRAMLRALKELEYVDYLLSTTVGMDGEPLGTVDGAFPWRKR